LTHSAGRILYLALADRRGHLMRAHLMRQALGRVDIGVEIATTGREGVRFLEGLGTPSALAALGTLSSRLETWPSCAAALRTSPCTRFWSAIRT